MFADYIAKNLFVLAPLVTVFGKDNEENKFEYAGTALFVLEKLELDYRGDVIPYAMKFIRRLNDFPSDQNCEASLKAIIRSQRAYVNLLESETAAPVSELNYALWAFMRALIIGHINYQVADALNKAKETISAARLDNVWPKDRKDKENIDYVKLLGVAEGIALAANPVVSLSIDDAIKRLTVERDRLDKEIANLKGVEKKEETVAIAQTAAE